MDFSIVPILTGSDCPDPNGMSRPVKSCRADANLVGMRICRGRNLLLPVVILGLLASSAQAGDRFLRADRPVMLMPRAADTVPRNRPDTLSPPDIAVQIALPRMAPPAPARPPRPFSDPATLIPMAAVLAVPQERDLSPGGGANVDQTPPIALARGGVDPGSLPDLPLQGDRMASLQPPQIPPALAPESLPEVGASLPPGPALGELRILLNAPQDVARGRIADVVAELRQAGFRPPDPNTVAFAISRSNVRYFHPGDEQAARILAERIGADLRDFTDFAPAPPEGTVEVWLAGRGAPQIRRAPARATRATPRSDPDQQEAQRLRRSILQRLRNAMTP